jgi:LacI family transcriptional regulator
MKRNDRNPTILDVAKQAGVGLMTVSRVINHYPSVRPSTRKRVLAAIEELGYRQNEAARLLKGRRAMTIGLIVPDLSDAFFASCAHTIQQLAREQGYMTLVVASERNSDLEIQQAELMASRKVAGVLIVTSTHNDERLKALQDSGLTIVAFDRPMTGVQTDAVVVENRAGAEEATRHLMKHGHKKIACVGYDQDVYPIQERISGYSSIMRAAGLKPEITYMSTLEQVRAWVAKITKLKDRPSAIFSLNHRTSVHLIQSMVESNVQIPKDIALVGFDDFELAGLLVPPLTTIAQSPVELARRSIGLLIERINNHRKPIEFTPAKIVLPVKMVLRSSCGCKNGNV